jgi:hypothetical protein
MRWARISITLAARRATRISASQRASASSLRFAMAHGARISLLLAAQTAYRALGASGEKRRRRVISAYLCASRVRALGSIALAPCGAANAQRITRSGGNMAASATAPHLLRTCLRFNA